MRIGIDLGGTKIEAVAIGHDGGEISRRRTDTPARDYRATVRAVAALVAAIEAEAGARGSVGVGIPGSLSAATGLVKGANSTWLIGRALDRDLAQALGRPVRLANDANCFALSEATDGAAAAARVAFGAILGTGVGGGLVVERRLVTGVNGIAGEWGHNPLPAMTDDERPGPLCYCGRRGCIETYLSGPGLGRDHEAVTGERLEPAAIAARAAAGDSVAEASMARYEARLARALGTVINTLDPEIIVLGGGLSNLARLYINVPALLHDHVFSDRVETHLVPPAHGDSSGVRGAAWLWPDDEAPA